MHGWLTPTAVPSKTVVPPLVLIVSLLLCPSIASAIIVNIVTPSSAATIFGGIRLEAQASDADGIAGVQFLLDGSALGPEVTAAPYAMGWNSATVGNSSHTLVARARSGTGATALSSPATFTVLNDGSSAQVGQWGPVMNWPLVAVHMTLLPDGQVIMWDSAHDDMVTYFWNPATQTFTSVDYDAGLFCNAHTLLPNGLLLTAGGHSHEDVTQEGDNGIGDGIAEANTMDFATHAWTRRADMRFARGYPTLTTLADGRAVAITGTMAYHIWADTMEVYYPGLDVWTPLSEYRTNEIRTGEYVRMHLLPDGRVYIFNPSSKQAWFLDVDTRLWGSTIPAPVGRGSTAMYRPGRILLSGGGTWGESSVPEAAVIDLTAGAPAWRMTTPMNFARYNHNLVQLPDGSVLAIGGATVVLSEATTGVLPAEVWNPSNEAWTTLAAMQEFRMYHSTALLLPDGRVLAAGGGRLTPEVPNHLTAEIYSPPYLFRGSRPVISSAPTEVDYGQPAVVNTPDAARVASVALIPLPSVTHTINTNQRYVSLPFTASASSVTAQVPANPNEAPGGYYMLFLVDTDGVPSVAKIVRLKAIPMAPPPQDQFLEVGGQVVMEADHYDARVDRNGKSWQTAWSPANFSWSGAVAALPNTGINADAGFTATSPELVYRIRFTTPGTYYVWVRAAGASGGDDTVHAGLDGAAPASADRIGSFPTTWRWRYNTMDGSPATLVVPTAGDHTFHLWMREDGVAVDKILLRRSTSPDAPGGSGSAQSHRVAAAADTAAPVLTNVAISQVTSFSARITWSTNEMGDSQVEHGKTASYGSKSTRDDRFLIDHAVTVFGLSPATTYHVRALSRDAELNVGASADATFQTLAATPGAFQELEGQVTIDAEHYGAMLPRNGLSWSLQTQQSGYAGAGYMAAPAPAATYDTGYVANSPELRYTAEFATPGTYYVWIRGAAPNTSSDSLHAGLDDEGPSSADRISGFGTGWTWRRNTMDANSPATLTVSSAGVHTIHLWMREPGLKVDRLLLRLNNLSTAPSGSGPAESSRE